MKSRSMPPERFANIRPWLASWIHPRFERPPVREMLYWLSRPGKERRAMSHIRQVEMDGAFKRIYFADYERALYYPADASWLDFCATVDECFNPRNWHCFAYGPAALRPDDIVLDCGADERAFRLPSRAPRQTGLCH
jgi:hypothetical protein